MATSPALKSQEPPLPDRDCPLCPRLVAFRLENRAKFPDWHYAPVPPFGGIDARLLIVGLAITVFLCLPPTQARRIEIVLQQERDLQESLHATSTFDLLVSGGKSIETYCAGLRRIDLTGCPERFRTEFEQYAAAQEKMRDLVSKELSMQGLVNAAVTRGISSRQFDLNMKRAGETAMHHFDRLLRAAVMYGATLPK